MQKRPTPEELLEYVQKEELSQSRGKLKIFLGAAPGVGKTYAMLEEALGKFKEGLDVVAGIVETHGRKETENLLKEFEVIPRRLINYHEKELAEFDIDAALTRQPGLLLVDEMAHSNIPGSRHNKRWQDIIELLDRGIDVYTTVNVQHIESLNNIISQITGFTVRETVPDTVLARAHAIELIDLPPEDLLKRLEEGKVYFPSEVNVAIENYFRKGNLTALRELALRTVTDQVSAEVLLHKHGELIEKVWPTTERLLVCVGPDPNSARLVRAAFRMARSLHAEWTAISVETASGQLSEDERRSINQHLRLAEQLGGESLIIHGVDIVKEVVNFVRDRNITKIILGKKVRTWWQDIFRRSLADELIRQNTDVDLYILRSTSDSIKQRPRIFQGGSSTPKIAYLISIIAVILCTIVDFSLYKYLELSTLVMIYFLGVIFVAARGYYGPAILTSILSVLFFGFFFMPPRFTFEIINTQYLVTLLTMLLVSQIITQLTIITKQQSKFSRLREQRISTMYRLSKQLASHRGVKNLLAVAVKHVSEVFDSNVLALLPDKNQRLVPVPRHGTNTLSSKDQSVAQWVYELGQIAGLGTETLPENEAIYIPMLGKKGTVGVLRVQPKNSSQLPILEQLHLLEGFANQIAMALEVDRLQDEAKKSEFEMETERVRNALLKYISDNMHAPLIKIMNSAKRLIDIESKLDGAAIQNLGNNIYFDSEELNHLINNLLQITHLETAGIAFTKKLHSLHKVAMAALKTLDRKLGRRTIKMGISDNLPKVYFNRVFIEQVFFNIIENAIKYTPDETNIEIVAVFEKERVVINIKDEGPGVALDEINKIFEKFYRGQAITHIKGMGLGLAICQRIIHLHGGEIWAENRPNKGAVFCFTLPLSF